MVDQFERYIASVQAQIRWKRARAGLADELRTHLLDQRDAYLTQGMTPEQADEESVRQMGDPVEVGTRLNRVHRPKPQWELLALIALVLLVGYLLQALTWELASQDSGVEPNFYQIHWALTAGIGVAVMLVIYFLDYTILGRRPLVWVCAGAVCSVAARFHSRTINGVNYEGQYCLLLAPLLLALLLYALRGKGWKGYFRFVIGIVFFQGLAFQVPSMFCFLLISLSGVLLLCLSVWRGWLGVSRKKGIAVTGGLAVVGVGLLAGLTVVALLAVLLVWLFRKAWKQRGMLGCLVSVAVALTLTMETVVYVAYDFGFQLLGPLCLPLISYGGQFMVLHLALLGLALSVFREESLPLRAQAGRSLLFSKPAWIVCLDGDLVFRLSLLKK